MTLIRCSFHPRVTAVARKRPRSFCQKCRWQVTLNTRTHLTQRSRSGLTILSTHSVGTNHENELTRNSSGNTRPQSFWLAEPLWTDSCASLSPLLHFRKAQVGTDSSKKNPYYTNIFLSNFIHQGQLNAKKNVKEKYCYFV